MFPWEHFQDKKMTQKPTSKEKTWRIHGELFPGVYLGYGAVGGGEAEGRAPSYSVPLCNAESVSSELAGFWEVKEPACARRRGRACRREGAPGVPHLPRQQGGARGPVCGSVLALLTAPGCFACRSELL